MGARGLDTSNTRIRLIRVSSDYASGVSVIDSDSISKQKPINPSLREGSLRERELYAGSP